MTLDVPSTITAFTGLVTAVGVIYVAWINKRAAIKAAVVGAQAVAAAENAAIAQEKTHGEMRQVHRLVNSHLTEIMSDKKVALRRLANKTKNAEDIAAAEKAEKQFADRMLAEKSQQDSDAKAKLEADGKEAVPIPT